MKFIIAIFRHIFTPLALILAVLAGLLAAFVSAMIEYSVLQEWLRPEGTGLLFLPLIIVASLEGTKLFLHFFGAALKQNQLSNEQKATIQGFFKVLPAIKYGLVIFSFICSLIFTSNAFYYKSVVGESDELTAAQAEIELQYDKNFEAKKIAAEESYQQAIAAHKENLQTAKEYWESVEIIYTPLYEYQRTSAEKKAAWETFLDAQTRYEQQEISARSERDGQIQSAETELNSWREEKLAELDHSIMGTVAGDNVYLRNFLLFFTQAFSNSGYSRITYWVWVLLISLSISALLEGVIMLSQYIISFPIPVLERLSSSLQVSAKERKKLTRVVQIFVSMAVAISIFLVYGAIEELVYTDLNIGAAVLCTLITVLIPPTITSIQCKAEDTGFQKAVVGIVSEARTIIIKGLLSFAGFVLIGLFFGENFATLSMPAIGVSLGNAAGHLLHIEIPAFQAEAHA